MKTKRGEYGASPECRGRGEHRENPLASGIVRHDSRVLKYGINPAGSRGVATILMSSACRTIGCSIPLDLQKTDLTGSAQPISVSQHRTAILSTRLAETAWIGFDVRILFVPICHEQPAFTKSVACLAGPGDDQAFHDCGTKLKQWGPPIFHARNAVGALLQPRPSRSRSCSQRKVFRVVRVVSHVSHYHCHAPLQIRGRHGPLPELVLGMNHSRGFLRGSPVSPGAAPYTTSLPPHLHSLTLVNNIERLKATSGLPSSGRCRNVRYHEVMKLLPPHLPHPHHPRAEATVAKRLACSPPTKVIRVQSRPHVGIVPDDVPLVGGFSRESPRRNEEGEKREISEKTRQPAALSTIPACENPRGDHARNRTRFALVGGELV
ncbi:hypothetical protein PR048_032533 [Dryococelus australis]|uniref:Uncharacterized protein n=1 Tax=Dryococelus australis TaxID=614101 RepID=A0ABQ9G3M5_9NEOP|nr:hypothetical protein PR048_032533 [Dryococelus australis]